MLNAIKNTTTRDETINSEINDGLISSLDPNSLDYDVIYVAFGLDRYDDNPSKILMNALKNYSEYDHEIARRVSSLKSKTEYLLYDILKVLKMQ